MLKGGWLLVGVFGAHVGFQVFNAIMQRRVTWQLIYWIGLFLAVLLIPARARRWRASQCLIVPGGIVFREARWRDDRWNLHVFDRRSSVLCVFQHRRHQWRFTVADDQACESAIGTREEVNTVLRAWLSPLSPPKKEALGDLV